MSPKQKGEFGERFVSKFFETMLMSKVERAVTSTAGHDRVIDGIRTEINFFIAARKVAPKLLYHQPHLRNQDTGTSRVLRYQPDQNEARLYYFTKEDFLR